MDEIVIIEPNPDWIKFFQQEAKAISEVLNKDLLIRIEHFGSTAVPNLPAKPIIDLLIEVSSLTSAKQVAIQPLKKLGYAYWADNPDYKRMFFVKGLPPNSPRTHHLHLVESDSVLWERLLFRDYLCQHPEEALNYARLKYQLAQKFTYDREAYTQGKTEYIQSIMQKARNIHSP